MEELVGALAGGRFHDSYFGLTSRPIINGVAALNNYARLRRGVFSSITSIWKTMSDADRLTFSAAAGSPSGGLRLFLVSNINLSLVSEPLISAFVSSAAPPVMPVQIDLLTLSDFIITASGPLVTVPAGHSLLIFSTECRAPGQIFNSPKDFFPILSIPAGTDMSLPFNIIAAWNNWFGRLIAGRQLCIKSALIAAVNGLRTDSAAVCAISSNYPANYIIDSAGSILADSDYTFITFP